MSNCSKCKLVAYCDKQCQIEDWKTGHKILCAKVPKAVKKAEEKIESFHLGDYTTRNIGTFMVTEAQARRGEIAEENYAQDVCYDAMEYEQGSTDKLQVILSALDHFPLSTEAWGMLGHFYQYEVTDDDLKKKTCSAEALKMYDIAIKCARILNPTWTDDRSNELSWGEIENRPYLRSLSGRAIALKTMGKRKDAIAQAKKIMRLNPGDNQGIRQLLVTWFLEDSDTEGCTNLLRKYGTKGENSLAYADVLLQYIRWKKDDVFENDVKKALYVALIANSFVPDLLGIVVEKDDDEDPCYSPGSLKEAKMYVTGAQKLWKKFPEAIEWISSQKYHRSEKVPTEEHLVHLLKSGTEIRMVCTHTDLDGNGGRESFILGTQKRSRCVGRGCADFHWPRQLNRSHEPHTDILLHNNDFDIGVGWRKTKYTAVKEVPFWRIFLQFSDEDSDNDDDDEQFSSLQLPPPNQQTIPSSLKCKKCNSTTTKFCALDNDCTDFYCSKACMSNFLEEVNPTYFDLQSTTLKVDAQEDCSINTVNLDDAFRVAGEHMPNLNSVDIHISQDFFLNCNGRGRKVVLSSATVKQFLEKTREKLVSVSIRLDDCCWEQMKKMTDRCRAFLPLGTMPNLKKLMLSNFGFDDVNTLTACLSASLQYLSIDYVKMGGTGDIAAFQMDTLAAKLSELTSLVSLSLADTACTDRHLEMILPNLPSIKYIDLSGSFGRAGTPGGPIVDHHLTDQGLKVIADNCRGLLCLTINYQRHLTTNGILALLKRCTHLIELEMAEINILPQHVAHVLQSSKKLLFLLYGNFGFGNAQEQMVINNAIQARKGKVVVCTGGGLLPVSLSSQHKRNYEETKVMIERANDQYYDPMIYNKWEGII